MQAQQALSWKDLDGITALMNAVQAGSERIIEVLLRCGTSVLPRDKCGYTAFDVAIASGRVACARLIMEGAKHRSQALGDALMTGSSLGKAALQAASRDHAPSIRYLTNLGVPLNSMRLLDITMQPTSILFELLRYCNDHKVQPDCSLKRAALPSPEPLLLLHDPL